MTRREALIGRFRAGALDRLRRSSVMLIDLEEGRGNQEMLQEVARELHTIKGESRMLGFGEISDAVHHAEDLLLSGGEGKLPTPSVAARVAGELATIARALRGEPETKNNAPPATATEPRVEGGPPAAKRPTPMMSMPPTPASTAASPAGQSPMHMLTMAPRPAGARSGSGQDPSQPPRLAEEAAPPPGPEPPDERSEDRAAAPLDRWVQVNATRIDDLCERVSAFAAEFRSLRMRLAGNQKDMTLGDPRWVRSVFEEYERCVTRLEEISSAAWALRLVPVEPALSELLRHARELAHEQNKRLRVTLHGGDVQLERSVLDSLWEPLLHLVRNAVDHGLETPADRGDKGPEGSLTLSAEAVGHHIVLTIVDDGRGIEPQRVLAAAVARGLVSSQAAAELSEQEIAELLFRHGFSTKGSASDLSGRGVGLDVVRGIVEGLGGTVSLSSEPGKGTRFALTVPATLTREHAIVVDCDGLLYGIPSRQVLEVRLLSDIRVEIVAGGRITRYQDEVVPLRSLQGAISGKAALQEPWVLIVELGGRRYAFAVPALLGEHELLRQPADPLLSRLSHIGASAMLDDGRLVLLLSGPGLLRKTEGRTAWARQSAAKRQRVLVVDDSPIIRDIVSQLLTSAGLDVQSAPEGKSALALVHQRSPDVMLLDVDMPGMNGFELLETLRKEGRSLPVIMFTTRFSPDDQHRAVSLGANAYLVKSQFQEATLVETVRRFARASA